MTVDATRAGDLALDVSVTAAEWSARLCAGAARPFTDAELVILPPGADTDALLLSNVLITSR